MQICTGSKKAGGVAGVGGARAEPEKAEPAVGAELDRCVNGDEFILAVFAVEMMKSLL